MRIQTSFDGELDIYLNEMLVWKFRQTPYEDASKDHVQLYSGQNELTFELKRMDAAVLAFSFRVVITWTP